MEVRTDVRVDARVDVGIAMVTAAAICQPARIAAPPSIRAAARKEKRAAANRTDAQGQGATGIRCAGGDPSATEVLAPTPTELAG